MGYGDYLRGLLSPLGVYDLREESFSGAAVCALGAALDAAWQDLQDAQRESLAMTAEDAGLKKMESLFPYLATGADAASRRAAVAGFLQVSGDSFTPAALARCLAACGTACTLREAGSETVAVAFPNVLGEPSGYAEKRKIIESILPCHLEILWDLRWRSFAEIEDYGLSWGDAAALSYYELAVYTPAQ